MHSYGCALGVLRGMCAYLGKICMAQKAPSFMAEKLRKFLGARLRKFLGAIRVFFDTGFGVAGAS